MQTIQRPPTGPPRGQSPVRGVVLVAVAVILGIFVLRAMDNTSADVGSAATDSTGTTAAGGDAGSTDTTAPAVRAPAEVIVIVANASGVSQAAGTKTQQLQAAGYQAVDPTNAPPDMELDTTQIMPSPGFEPEAAKLAGELGLQPESVQPLPDPSPVDLAGANILGLMGTDIAGG
jgi:LytR cell envelope-related transcriptional attenuator